MLHDCLLIVSWSREAYGPSFKHPKELWSTQSCGWFALGSLLFPRPLSHPQAFREEGGGSHTWLSLRGWEQIHLSTLTKGALPKMTVLSKLWPSPVVSLMPWHAGHLIVCDSKWRHCSTGATGKFHDVSDYGTRQPHAMWSFGPYKAVHTH